MRVYPQYVYTDSYIYIYVYTYTCTNIFIDDSRLPFKPSLMCLFSMRTQADARSSLFIPRFLSSTWTYRTFVRPVKFFFTVGSVRASAGRSISIYLRSRSIFLRIFLNNSSFLSVIGRFELGNRLEVFLERSPAGRSSFKISAGPTILGHGISAIPPRWNALLDWERMDSESRWKLHSGISEFHPFISRMVCILVSICISVSRIIN